MLIKINDNLISKLREQADDKDLSEIMAHAIEFFLTCSEAEATAPSIRKSPLK